MMARFKIPDKEIEQAPLSIEITLPVKQWRELKMGDKWPDWQIAVMIRDALDHFDNLTGRRYVYRHNGPSEIEE